MQSRMTHVNLSVYSIIQVLNQICWDENGDKKKVRPAQILFSELIRESWGFHLILDHWNLSNWRAKPRFHHLHILTHRNGESRLTCDVSQHSDQLHRSWSHFYVTAESLNLCWESVIRESWWIWAERQLTQDGTSGTCLTRLPHTMFEVGTWSSYGYDSPLDHQLK